MASSQSEFPLTLAEVLFEEIENSNRGMDTRTTEIYADVIYDEKQHRAAAYVRASTSGGEWEKIEEEIELLRQLPDRPRDEIAEIVKDRKFDIDPSKEDLFNLIRKCRKEINAQLVPRLYKFIHALPDRRSALCLSGGGVRSATFNLGVLQGLARCGLLDKFDYLSTVSGGGFIGSWLSAWIHREGKAIGKVSQWLADPPSDPLKPEPDPLYKLRIYANYLTPKKGLLSVDTWTLIAVYLRNLILNWLVFIPVIVAFLILPRIWLAFVKSPYASSTLCLRIGFVGAAIALTFIGLNLPGAKRLNKSAGWFVGLCLLPLIISAMALTTYWVRLRVGEVPDWWQFTKFALMLAALPWGLYVVLSLSARLRDSKSRDSDDDEGARHSGSWLMTLALHASATVLILAAFAATGLLTWYLVTTQISAPLNLSNSFARTYASFAVPVLLLMLTVGGTLISGFTSRFTGVEDQEWWARSGAWILMSVAAWCIFDAIVLFGPSLFVELQAQLMQNKDLTWSSAKGLGTMLIGVVSGAITLFGGFSTKTSANGEPADQSGVKSKLPSIATTVAAIIFGTFIAIVLALITDWILASSLGNWGSVKLGSGPLTLNANDPRTILYKSPGRLLVVLVAIIALVGCVLGRFINTNRFSLHYYWRNRIMRAYLGASLKDRKDTKDEFTDFNVHDNIQMYELKQRPLHVVNVTLNLVGGDRLEWQDRKAESFTVSPLHAGSYWLGYRNSRYYGGDDGISLATAVAISGAAASPNMGYMMTSPIVRFIMTLFNVRLGFWLGNPGVAGSGDPTTFNRPTYDRDSPTQSVRPIFSEALGMTDSRSPYVYLSDGGHFDNLGLYEMILRRCRFIVISDASTDPAYALESLAFSIRQIRIDFGVPIEIDDVNFAKKPEKKNKYCAIGRIRYSCVDKPKGSVEKDDVYDGTLIYVKPSLDSTEPRDVLNYHAGSGSFPQDTIADQWFSEAQFESYRMLGSHMIQSITGDMRAPSNSPLQWFKQQAAEYLKKTSP
ncbi:MAG: hypothetical protein QOH42_461 [Blastocatellia bacterium]|nr:hypothetical protein [Blastocatellia bacterium]